MKTEPTQRHEDPGTVPLRPRPGRFRVARSARGWHSSVRPQSWRATNSLRPTVTHNGGAYVDFGKIPADVVEQIAEALRLPATPLASAPLWRQGLGRHTHREQVQR